MTQSKRVAAQRKVVVEQLQVNSSPVVFDLLVEILSIEREHRDHKHGVQIAIKNAIERVAEHDLTDNSE